MIDPSHECRWSRRKELNLSIRNGELCCGGACAEAVLHGFRGRDVILIVEGSPEDSEVWVFERTVGEEFGLKEGSSRQVLMIGSLNLPIVLIQDDAPVELHSIQPLAKLHSHDNCFFSLKTSDETVISGAFDGLLQLLAGYFGFEIDWSAACDKVLSLSHSVQGVTLQCDLEQNCVYVVEAKKQFFIPRRKYATISVADGMAAVLH